MRLLLDLAQVIFGLSMVLVGMIFALWPVWLTIAALKFIFG